MKLLVAGDFCPRERVLEAFDRKDYQSIIGDVRNLTKKADFSLVNLECPIVSGYSKPIKKKGPNLCCTPNAVEAILYAGFSGVTLANNHFLDYGKEGVEQTISAIKDAGIDYVGGGMDLSDASKILYKKIEGKTLAIINCCEHEFSIATETSAGCNPLNPITQYYEIVKARKYADVVVIIVHGGHEHFQLPSVRMVETYRFFIDAGADAVINHHQHCFSGYELYKEKPIFYGLGNFCFDNHQHRKDIWTEGYTVLLEFNDKKLSFELYPYKQCAEDAKVELLEKDVFDERIAELNAIIADPIVLKSEIDKYYASCTSLYRSIFEPFYNRYVIAARCRGLFPYFISKKRLFSAMNYIQCEAHRDKLLWWLNHANK